MGPLLAGVVTGAGAEPLLRLQSISRSYRLGGSPWSRVFRHHNDFFAAADVSLDIAAGEVLGLVGESGSGKSTLGRIVAGLVTPSAGRLMYRGQDVATLDRPAILSYRREVQMVFQDTHASLNPRKRVGRAVTEALAARGVEPAARSGEARALLGMVGLAPTMLERYPHELSGGQRQRVCIARALAMRPTLLIADEPVSALDVSLQGQVVNLLLQLHRELGLTVLFISHDLAVVRRICTRIAVMYAGRIVELGFSDQLMTAPAHPYTQALIDAVPRGLAGRGHAAPRLAALAERPPAHGCPFQPRCPRAEPCCAETIPSRIPVAPGHHAACLRAYPVPALARAPTRSTAMEEALDVHPDSPAQHHT